MKKVLALLLFSIIVLLPACTQTVNGCKIREETQCSKFDMRGADLNEASLSGADLNYADLQGADLTGIDLNTTQLSLAKYNNNTKFPEGFDPQKSGMQVWNWMNDPLAVGV